MLRMEKQPPKKDPLAEAKRIMERLVNTPHKLHKDEPSHKPRPASKRRVHKGRQK